MSEQATATHTISVLVDNEAGVLARVIGLFSGRGYNIDSLTVAEVDQAAQMSRITIVTSGTPQVIEQIKAQLGRLVPVHRVVDLTVECDSVERELAALNRRLNDLKRRQEAIHMRVFTRNHDEPYPADARDGDLVVTIEPPLNWLD